MWFTYCAGDHTKQCCQSEAQLQDQTNALERNHTHDSPLCFLLVPSNPQAHHTPKMVMNRNFLLTNRRIKSIRWLGVEF